MPTPDRAPNLLFLFADQMNYQSGGFAGESRAHTPNLDWLAAQGVCFDQAVSCYPLCGPYRASLLTGKYPCRTGHFRNDVRVRPDPDALGHVLDRAGYHTGYIGKWHLYCREGHEQFTPPGPYRLGFDQYFASYNWNHDYWNGRYYLDDGAAHELPGYQEDSQTDLALDFIDRHAGDPFALVVSYEVPHPPCTPEDVPRRFYDIFKNTDFSDLLYNTDGVFQDFEPGFDRRWQQERVIDVHNERCRTYFAMQACLDENIGRLLTALSAKGILDNTIVVFTSDHGDMVGGNGRIEKRIFYEQSTRVPFLVHWPAGLPAGVRHQGLLNTPDIAPTLTELLGIAAPSAWQGFSWAGAMRGAAVDEPDCAFLTMMHGGFFNRHEEYRGIRDHRYVYARLVRSGKEFLYDHRSDPRQVCNLAASPEAASLLGPMRDRLQAQMDRIGDIERPPEWYETEWIRDGCVVDAASPQSPSG